MQSATAPGAFILTSRNEFSRMQLLDPWPEEGIAFDETASADERAALTMRLVLIGLPRLRVAGTIAPDGTGHGFVVDAVLEADLVQRCVVSLEPVSARVRERLERRYVLGEVGEAEVDVEVDLDAEEPEPLLGPLLDLGEMAVEALALAMDPYPRAPGADEIVQRYAPGEAEDGRPFDRLRQMR
jgi:uncharacterized metal-binding protein YceD (DUF177 family)